MNNTPRSCTYIGPQHSESSCIHTALDDQQYCSIHYPIVYNVGSAHRKRHKDIRVAEYVQDIGSLFNDVVAELEDTGELEL
jgi:hypothetical protein